jgi:hypothetical protein
MNLSGLLSLAAVIFALGNGIGKIVAGRKILITQTYTHKMGLSRITVTRNGNNTRPYGISMVLSGIICITVIVVLLINSIYDPLALIVYPIVGGGIFEIVGGEISERHFRSEST